MSVIQAFLHILQKLRDFHVFCQSGAEMNPEKFPYKNPYSSLESLDEDDITRLK